MVYVIFYLSVTKFSQNVINFDAATRISIGLIIRSGYPFVYCLCDCQRTVCVRNGVVGHITGQNTLDSLRIYARINVIIQKGNSAESKLGIYKCINGNIVSVRILNIDAALRRCAVDHDIASGILKGLIARNHEYLIRCDRKGCPYLICRKIICSLSCGNTDLIDTYFLGHFEKLVAILVVPLDR